MRLCAFFLHSQYSVDKNRRKYRKTGQHVSTHTNHRQLATSGVHFFTVSSREKLVICRITGTLHEDQYTFLIIYYSFLLRMRNVSERSCRENQNTHFMFNNIFFRKLCLLWDNAEEYCRAGRPQIIWRVRIAWWIPEATNKLSEY